MVPARIVVLERLPLTPNGKIDRKALPAPDQLATSIAHVAPRTPAEAALAAIWADLLRQPNIGVTDNFFELGGDSRSPSSSSAASSAISATTCRSTVCLK